jgi:transposase
LHSFASNGGIEEVLLVSELWLLIEAQMRRIEPYFPLSHGIPRVVDRRVVSGIVFVIRNGLRWRDAPTAYGPHKTIYNRLVAPPFGSSAGAAWACSTASSPDSQPSAASPIS